MSDFAHRLRRVLIRRVGWLAVLLGLTTLRLLTDGGFSPAVATELYLLALTGLVVLWFLQVLVNAESFERPGRPGARRPASGGRPEALTRLEGDVQWWSRLAYHRHTAMRPAVRSLAVDRLHRAGIDFEDNPRAEQILGPVGWWLVRPGVEPPADDAAAGLTAAQARELARTLTALTRPDFASSDRATTDMTGDQH
jgi:hypothetical protein